MRFWCQRRFRRKVGSIPELVGLDCHARALGTPLRDSKHALPPIFVPFVPADTKEPKVHREDGFCSTAHPLSFSASTPFPNRLCVFFVALFFLRKFVKLWGSRRSRSNRNRKAVDFENPDMMVKKVRLRRGMYSGGYDM